MAEGQHVDCPGPDWHILGRLTDGERERGGRGWGAGESQAPQDVLSHCQPQKCGWEIAGPRAVLHHTHKHTCTDSDNKEMEQDMDQDG